MSQGRTPGLATLTTLDKTVAGAPFNRGQDCLEDEQPA